MPRLLAFFPCEKIVIDTANNVTAVSMLQECRVQIPAGAGAPPRGTVVPYSWTAFSLWQREDQDQDTPFESRSVLVSPSGETLIEGSLATNNYDNFTKQYQRVVEQFPVLPVWSQGRCNLVLKYRLRGEQDFRDVARFPFDIIHEQASSPQN